MAYNYCANRGNLNSMYSGIIYQYRINNKYYVGKTYGLERKRIDKHKYEALTLNSDRPFARAIRKYGWDEVLSGYSVIERITADTKEELNLLLIQREAYWIRERNSIVPNGYNVFKSGQIEIPHTNNKDEIYSRVSKSLKGKYMNADYSSRKVYCIEQDKWYPSISEAERQHNLSNGSVGKAASGIQITAGGYTWSFDGSKTIRDNKLKASRKPVRCLETGEKFDSVYDAAKSVYGSNANKKKCIILASIKHGWAASGKHYEYIEHDDPVLSETEV
jgi:hypothetical protein